MIGQEYVQERIRNFEESIELKPLSRDDIGIIARGIDTFEQVDSTKDFKKLNTLSHIVAQYAPTEKQGAKFKKQLLNRIVQLAESASFSDLNVLRNFKTESFHHSKKTYQQH